MKSICLLLLVTFFFMQIKAQTFPVVGETLQKRCAIYEVMEGQRRLHPDMETTEHFENWLHQKMEQRRGDRVQAVVILPVVFHIIHNNQAVGTGSNLGASVIQQQVMQLNKD